MKKRIIKKKKGLRRFKRAYGHDRHCCRYLGQVPHVVLQNAQYMVFYCKDQGLYNGFDRANYRRPWSFNKQSLQSQIDFCYENQDKNYQIFYNSIYDVIRASAVPG